MNNINNTRRSAQTDRTTRTPTQRTSSGRNASGSRIGHSSEGNTYGGGAYADDTYVRRPSGSRSAAHDQARRSRSGGRRYPTSGGGATAHRNPLSPPVPQLIAALLCALDGLPANSLRCAPDAAERLLRGRSPPRSRQTFCRRAARALPRNSLSAALSILFTPLPAGACGCAHTQPSIGKARTVIGSGLRFAAYSAKYSASISAHRA